MAVPCRVLILMTQKLSPKLPVLVIVVPILAKIVLTTVILAKILSDNYKLLLRPKL